MNSAFSVYRKIDTSPAVAVDGKVTTKPHIVDLMLDLSGYSGSSLRSKSLLDPGCGQGAFVVRAARRLVASLRKTAEFDDLADCLVGIDKDADAIKVCRLQVIDALISGGIPRRLATKLAERWIVCADFLDHPLGRHFDFVVGNPPYVRQEAIPKKSLERYRSVFECFYDRADLYVAFFENGLNLLRPGGTLGFICPDRFTRNNYGKKLRGLISERFAVRHVLDLAQASPFEPDVTCYPGIFIITEGKAAGAVHHLRLTDGGPDECNAVRSAVSNGCGRVRSESKVIHHRYEAWFSGEEQWAVESPAHLELMRRLEADGVPLGEEASGCRVGIGVATGADDVFIVDANFVEVEHELLMPLVTTRDIASGRVDWTRNCVINPFANGDSTNLIDLRKFPKAKSYFERHRARLCGRNVAQRDLDRWYRTIDRIYPSLRTTPKLLIPDIKAENLIVLEQGRLYPHHNLYYVASEYWDLRALRTILRSSLGRFFIWMYGVKMRGDFLRFQAQYLRRICIPPLMSIPKATLKKMIAVDGSPDASEVDGVVAELYGLNDEELELVQGTSARRRAN